MRRLEFAAYVIGLFCACAVFAVAADAYEWSLEPWVAHARLGDTEYEDSYDLGSIHASTWGDNETLDTTTSLGVKAILPVLRNVELRPEVQWTKRFAEMRANIPQSTGPTGQMRREDERSGFGVKVALRFHFGRPAK